MGDRRHSGKRVAERPPRGSRGSRLVVLPLAGGITLCVVAWGYLVKAAIDFGTAARTGKTGSTAAWTYLGLASLGAVACLFVGLILVARIGRALGWSSSTDQSREPERTAGPRPVGGRRRAK